MTPIQSTFLIVFANFSILLSSLSDIMEMHLFLNAPQCKMCRLVNGGASFFYASVTVHELTPQKPGEF
jgi:hypothetical protein